MNAPQDPFIITLLGRPAIAGDELAGALAPTLLGLLAVRANESIEFDVLIDQVYRYEPPATATKTATNDTHPNRARPRLKYAQGPPSKAVLTSRTGRHRGLELPVAGFRLRTRRWDRADTARFPKASDRNATRYAAL